MKPEQLLSAIGDINDEYIQEDIPMKKLRRSALLILAAALVLLSAVGYAAACTGIIDRLFTLGTPGPNAEGMVTPVGQTASGELVSLTVNDYIFDGNWLYVDWTVQMNTDEALVLHGGRMETAFASDYFLDNSAPGSLGDMERDTTRFKNGALSGVNEGYFYESLPTEPFDVTLRIALIRPDPDAVFIKNTDMGSWPDQPVWVEVLDGEYYTAYGPWQIEEEDGLSSGQSFAYSDWVSARIEELGLERAVVEGFEQFGFGSVLEELSVTFTVYPEGLQGTHLPETVRFERDGYTLDVLKASFTGVNANIECGVISDAPESFFDLDFALYIGGERAKIAVQKDSGPSGPYAFTVDFWSEGGFSETPDEITIMPGRYENTGEGMVFIPAEGQEMTVSLR